jgi:hypothetical protein
MADIPSFLRRTAQYAALVGAVLVVIGMAWTLGPGAGWFLRHVDGVRGLSGKELADAQDAVRGRILTAATGLAALAAVYFTARNAETARKALLHSVEAARWTAELTEQGQVTERYTKAIEQLGSDKIDIRVDGIYSLERIAADSPRDHPTIMEVLIAFLFGRNTPAAPPADKQAALNVISRRTAADRLPRGTTPTRRNVRMPQAWECPPCPPTAPELGKPGGHDGGHRRDTVSPGTPKR